jgi:hypothetical protein
MAVAVSQLKRSGGGSGMRQARYGVRQCSQNGCDTIAVTAMSKSSATRWPRSTHDSNPTSLLIVADQCQPGKLRCPLCDRV